MVKGGGIGGCGRAERRHALSSVSKRRCSPPEPREWLWPVLVGWRVGWHFELAGRRHPDQSAQWRSAEIPAVKRLPPKIRGRPVVMREGVLRPRRAESRPLQGEPSASAFSVRGGEFVRMHFEYYIIRESGRVDRCIHSDPSSPNLTLPVDQANAVLTQLRSSSPEKPLYSQDTYLTPQALSWDLFWSSSSHFRRDGVGIAPIFRTRLPYAPLRPRLRP